MFLHQCGVERSKVGDGIDKDCTADTFFDSEVKDVLQSSQV